MKPFSLYMLNANKTMSVLSRLISHLELMPDEFYEEAFSHSVSRIGTSLYVVCSGVVAWYQSAEDSFSITLWESDSSMILNVQNVTNRQELVLTITHHIPESKQIGVSFDSNRGERYTNVNGHKSRYAPDTHGELDPMLDKLANLAGAMREWETWSRERNHLKAS